MKTFLLSLTTAFLSLTGIAYAQSPAPAESPENTVDIAPAVKVIDWKICNETSYALRLATATVVDGTMKPKGWSKLRAGSCLSVPSEADMPRFVYAESSKAHRGGVREWKGSIVLCAGEEDFVADGNIGCALQNLSTRPYIAVDPEDLVTTLVEPDDYGKMAATAGIQRLLRDNGYAITRIDGRAGQRTSQTLSKFLKDNELPTSLSVEEQLDLLEQGGLAKVKTVGLNVCNRSSEKIWVAIGLRRKGNWESRGWWPIEKDGCEQPFTESLTRADMSFYAVQEKPSEENSEAPTQEKVLRAASTTPEVFCIAESRFSVLGREDCPGQGYDSAKFRTLPIDKEGMTITLTDADFVDAVIAGLR